MSWDASDAVWELFPPERPDCEQRMMLAIAHHYNDEKGCSRPGIPTLAKKCRCKKRWAIELRDRCIASGDAFIINKGGKGPGDLMSIGLAQKYVDWINARVHSRTTPIDKNKGVVSSARKGALSSARKGALPYREKCSRKIESKEKAAAASAVAMPPPPLPTEEELAETEKFQAEFERAKGRKLLGAK